MQRGLIYPAPFAFTTFFLKTAPVVTAKGTTSSSSSSSSSSTSSSSSSSRKAGAIMHLADLTNVVTEVRNFIHKKCPDSNTTAIVGVGFKLWASWVGVDFVPASMKLRFPLSPDEPLQSNVFHQPGISTYNDAQADLWFNIKSDNKEFIKPVFDKLAALLQAWVDSTKTWYEYCNSRPGGFSKCPMEGAAAVAAAAADAAAAAAAPGSATAPGSDVKTARSKRKNDNDDDADDDDDADGTGGGPNTRATGGGSSVRNAAGKKYSPQSDGRVLGGRFSENLNNPADPVTIQDNALVGFEDPNHLGASFVLAQRFLINWSHVLNQSPQNVEDMVGRAVTTDTIIPCKDTRSHIKASRVLDENGETRFIMRLSLPFGSSSAVQDDDLRSKGAKLSDEKGLYFAGFSKAARYLEQAISQQIGMVEGFVRDRLLASMHSTLGGLYYVPSRADLNLPPEVEVSKDWKRFPGMNPERLLRHFTDASSNGYMHYSHQEYLYRMATMSPEDQAKFNPPSMRILRLLSVTFNRWQDGWYYSRKQDEMETLQQYLSRTKGEAETNRIMQLPIAERRGWAIRIALGEIFASYEYGGRWRKQDAATGNWRNGADTFHVNPLDWIAGSMNNIGIGQGKYMIDDERSDEEASNFYSTLSYGSMVGHVVPKHSILLEKGLGGLIKDAHDYADKVKKKKAPTTTTTTTTSTTSTTSTTYTPAAGSCLDGVPPTRAEDPVKKLQFYAGVVQALQGVCDYLDKYAKLAATRAKELPASMRAERENLQQMSERLTYLSKGGAPRTFLEAVQLLFTMHCCLHLIGEVVAIGRIDQLLGSFYEKDVAKGTLTEEIAQEILDALWIKLGEKVQLNRLYLEDHQPFGNLAMGGTSGNYPQGSSNNQWIQQVTVGGTMADNSPGLGKQAYNRVTILCLRCARRLPMNAPCLSLRVRSDMPLEVMEEAAKSLLSGGAHPILLHDEKIIPGMMQSGDNIGRGDLSKPPTESTPVAEKADGRWSSKVELAHARDYACDGCYEPQLSGMNWFTLGGFCMLQPLEAALNRGKLWSDAGPRWFTGQRASKMWDPVEKIESYDQLEKLMFEHFVLMYGKQMNSQISIFGQMADTSPTPLLSALTDSCMAKGLDLYGAGARYNIIAPCFTGLSSLINSLWAIKSMVFDENTAVTSLPELTEALMCDWGYKMVEPFISPLMGAARIEARAHRFKQLREVALNLPRFGRGHKDVDAFGQHIMQLTTETTVSLFTNPTAGTAKSMLNAAKNYGTKEHPFGGFQIQPGVGTFENYLDWGATEGASADGRRLGDPIASDLSAAPSFGDLPIDHQEAKFIESLRGFTGPATDRFWDAAPTDFNIREDFPLPKLVEVIKSFAVDKQGSNLLTITVANPETFANAGKDPEKYDLLRVRMGGWTEFFVAMFPAHQSEHQRRPLSTPG